MHGRNLPFRPALLRSFGIVTIGAAAFFAHAQPVLGQALLAQRGDAFVTSEGRSDAWTIGNQQIAYTVGFDDTGRLVTRDLTNGIGGRSWSPERRPDATFKVGGRASTLTRADAGGFVLERAETAEAGLGLTLQLVFVNSRDGLMATRHYAVYPGTPVVETWLTFAGISARTVALSDLHSLNVTADGSDITWVRGLEGPAESGGPFTIEKRLLRGGEAFSIEAAGRSTQSALPSFSIRSPQGTFFGGLMWSGSWRIDLIGQSRNRFEAAVGIGDTATQTTTELRLEMPHAFFGVVPGDEAAVAPALHQFIIRGVRGGRPLTPLVTYNSWFLSGTAIDEDLIVRQVRAAASVGAEVFELDAGWYRGAGEEDDFDFSSGLGNWQVDRDKFPSGLRPIGELARSLGMKFGLWVEPERVDLRQVGTRRNMVRPEWLAQSDGSYQPGVSNADARYALIDLGVPEARAWVVNRLVALIETHGVDYVKWDNNFWINDNRARAGRTERDGNYHQVRGLYAVLAELRARYPDLLIENCSGGGNRLDLEMMRYTDVGWMDDRTAPSSYVRHNLQGLTTVMPPAYLLSYLISHGDEPMADAPDLGLYARSRMPGVFGLSFGPDELSEADVMRLRQETGLWKAYRDLQRDASAVLLTPQAHGPAAASWDAVALVTPSRDQALVYAYQTDPAAGSVTLTLRGLDPAATYELRAPGGASMGTATGDAFMRSGIALTGSSDGAAHVLELRATAPEAARAP